MRTNPQLLNGTGKIMNLVNGVYMRGVEPGARDAGVNIMTSTNERGECQGKERSAAGYHALDGVPGLPEHRPGPIVLWVIVIGLTGLRLGIRCRLGVIGPMANLGYGVALHTSSASHALVNRWI